jgi:hypothetical protein
VVHSEVIKGAINKEAKIPGTAAKKEAKGIPELVPDGVFVKVEPLGHDRDKNRIWSFDSKSILHIHELTTRFGPNIQIWKPI